MIRPLLVATPKKDRWLLNLAPQEPWNTSRFREVEPNRNKNKEHLQACQILAPPHLPFKKPQTSSNRDYKNLNGGTLRGGQVYLGGFLVTLDLPSEIVGHRYSYCESMRLLATLNPSPTVGMPGGSGMGGGRGSTG